MATTRPVSGAAIATDWGQEIHDEVNFPRGGRYTGAAVAVVAATLTKLPITAVTTGAAWVDTGDVLIGAGGAGLYHIIAAIENTAGAAAAVKHEMRRNGVAVTANGNGAMNAIGSHLEQNRYLDLAVGDRLSLWVTPGANLTCLPIIQLIRVGESAA